MRAIVGVQRVTAGSVRVLDAPAGAPQLRRRLGYLTQAPSVYPVCPFARTCATSRACSASGASGSTT
jgi:ABC-type multidrug transport system ATPase subunit